MLKRIAAFIGPGVITASLVLCPGSMTVATKVGSLFGKEKNRLGTNLLAGLGFAVVVYLFIDLVKTLAATAVHL